MARRMPYFAEGGGANAASEYIAFGLEVGDPAAHLLAELVRIHNQGRLEDIPTKDADATNVHDLYCRQLDRWVVFYTVEPTPTCCLVTIILVGKLNPHSFGALENEAETRMRRLEA